MKYNITVLPVVKEMANVSAFLQSKLSGWSISEHDSNMILVVLDELLSNIVHYSSATFVTVGCEYRDNIFFLGFSDDGVEFDPTASAEPELDRTMELCELGGFGISIVKNSAESMDYERKDGKNNVILKFECTPSDGTADKV